MKRPYTTYYTARSPIFYPNEDIFAFRRGLPQGIHLMLPIPNQRTESHFGVAPWAEWEMDCSIGSGDFAGQSFGRKISRDEARKMAGKDFHRIKATIDFKNS